MPIAVADHHLEDFDKWLELFTANPPPEIGTWRLLRGIDDPNRVYVVGEVSAAEVRDVNDFVASEQMQKVFDKVNELSTAPIEWIWFEDVTPG